MVKIPLIPLLDGNLIPALAFGTGTAWFGATGPNGISQPLVEAVKAALKVGFRHIDSAEGYSNEASTGIAIKESGISRNELFVTSKVMGGLRDVGGTLRKQLDELGVSYLDLYLIHSPMKDGQPGYPSLEDQWREMEKVKDEGLVKSIGLSNFRVKDLERIIKIAKHKPVINQIEFNPNILLIPSTTSLLKYMKEHSILLASYGPIGPITRGESGPIHTLLDSLSSETKLTPSQLLLKYAYLPPVLDAPSVVVTTSGKEWRMKEALEGFEEGGGKKVELEVGVREKIDRAAKEGGRAKRNFQRHMDDL